MTLVSFPPSSRPPLFLRRVRRHPPRKTLSPSEPSASAGRDPPGAAAHCLSSPSCHYGPARRSDVTRSARQGKQTQLPQEVEGGGGGPEAGGAGGAYQTRRDELQSHSGVTRERSCWEENKSSHSRFILLISAFVRVRSPRPLIKGSFCTSCNRPESRKSAAVTPFISRTSGGLTASPGRRHGPDPTGGRVQAPSARRGRSSETPR